MFDFRQTFRLHVRGIAVGFFFLLSFIATASMAAQGAATDENNSRIVMIILVIQGLIAGAVAVIYQRQDKGQDRFVTYVAEDQHAQGTTDARLVEHKEAVSRFQIRFDSLPEEMRASRHLLKNELTPEIANIQDTLMSLMAQTEARMTSQIRDVEQRLSGRMDREVK